MNGDVRRLENAVCVVFYFLVQIGIGADVDKVAVGIGDRVHRFAIPVLLFVLMFIISMLELAGYVATYLNQTPPTYLPEYHGIDFWRLFI